MKTYLFPRLSDTDKDNMRHAERGPEALLCLHHVNPVAGWWRWWNRRRSSVNFRGHDIFAR